MTAAGRASVRSDELVQAEPLSNWAKGGVKYSLLVPFLCRHDRLLADMAKWNNEGILANYITPDSHGRRDGAKAPNGRGFHLPNAGCVGC